MVMHHSWLLIRNLRDDCRDEVIARELDCTKRAMYKRSFRLATLHQAIEPVFRNIWLKGKTGLGTGLMTGTAGPFQSLNEEQLDHRLRLQNSIFVEKTSSLL